MQQNPRFAAAHESAALLIVERWGAPTPESDTAAMEHARSHAETSPQLGVWNMLLSRPTNFVAAIKSFPLQVAWFTRPCRPEPHWTSS